MLMSVIEGARSVPVYKELAGHRVLITGLSRSGGVDIARAFADHKARLILQFAEEGDEMQAVAEIAARAALDIKAFGPVASQEDAVVQFARSAVQAFGGLDAVVNLVPLGDMALPASATTGDIERLVASRLLLPYLISKIAANRMALCQTEGLILNVATLGVPVGGHAQAFAAVMKAALTTLTRAQAEEWAGKAIRFNAIAPQTAQAPAAPSLTGEPDIAALALYLASGRGKTLSGHVFDAELK